MHRPTHKDSKLSTISEATTDNDAQLRELLKAQIRQRKKLVALLESHGIDPREADNLSVSDDSGDLPKRRVMLEQTRPQHMPRKPKTNPKSRPSTWASMVVKQKVEDESWDKDLSHHLKGIATIMPTLPKVVVCFHHLKLHVCTEKRRTNTFASWLKGVSGPNVTSQPKAQGQIILNGLTGMLQPGRTTLVMGALGSGTSSFLQVLSHVITNDTHGLKLEGRVTYNGKTADSGAFVPYRVASYVGEYIPLLSRLTVEETLVFAHTLEDGAPSLVRRLRSATVDTSFRSLMAKREAANLVEKVSQKQVRVREIMQLASLESCKHKRVEQLNRSEKRRVGICERFVGWQKVFMMDQITMGLDSYMSYELVRAVVLTTQAFAYTTAIAIVQPPPEIFELVDDVLVLCKGSIIYHGPVAQVRQHFESLQLYCPPRRDLGNFLEEISETEGSIAETNHSVVPLLAVKPQPKTVRQLVHRFHESALYHSNQDTLRQAIHQLEHSHQSTNLLGGSSASLGAVAATDSLFSEEQRKKYLISWYRATRLAISRRALVIARNKAIPLAIVMKPLFASLLTGSLWFNLDKDKYSNKFGLIFQTCAAMMGAGSVGIAGVISDRQVFYGQRDSRLLPAKSYVLGQALGVLQFNIVWLLLYLVPVYFMCGFALDNHGVRFGLYLCICFSLCVATGQFYRTVASLCPNYFWLTGGLSVASIAMTLFSGFAVSESIIPPYWRWFFWLNPLAWAFRALVLVEFRSEVYSQPATNGNMTLGDLYMDAYGFRKESHWVWGAIVYMWAFFFFQLMLTWLVHKYVRHGVIGGTPRRKPQPGNNRHSVASNASDNTKPSPVLQAASPTLQPASPALQPATPGGQPKSPIRQPKSPVTQPKSATLQTADPIVEAPNTPDRSDPVVGKESQKKHTLSAQLHVNCADLTPDTNNTNEILLTPAHFFETIHEDGTNVANDNRSNSLAYAFERGQTVSKQHSTGRLESSPTSGGDKHHTRMGLMSNILQSFTQNTEPEKSKNRQDTELEDLSPQTHAGDTSLQHQSGTVLPPTSLQSTPNSSPQPTESTEFQLASQTKSPMTEHESPIAANISLTKPVKLDNSVGNVQSPEMPAKGPVLMLGASPVMFQRTSPTKQHAEKIAKTLQLHLNHLPHFGQQSVLSPGVRALEDLPFTPISLVFKNIWKSVTSKVKDHKESLDVLQGVTGFALPGTMTAIMGSPGSAKSTLLDTIGAIQDDPRVLINGHVKRARQFAHLSGFVRKRNAHPRFVTVRECISFNTELRLPRNVKAEKTKKFVDFVLHQLGLTEDENELVGHLPDEQIKLLSVATQLAANPAILFIDEPTSDLHSHSAAMVLNSIKRIAKTNRSIVCTIHQPSADLLQMFDQLLLLTKSGRVAYFGPVGEDFHDLVSFFGRLPKCPRMRPGANPATHILDVLADQEIDVPGAYEKSTQRKINERTLVRSSEIGTIPVHANYRFIAPLWIQIKVLTQRAFKSYLRSPSYSKMRLLVGVLGGLVCGSVWVRSEIDSQTRVFSRIASISMMCGFLASIHASPALTFSYDEFLVFLRERQQHLYSTATYVLAFFVSELPFVLLDTLLFSLAFYFTVGLDSKAHKFGFFWLFYLLIISFSTLLGQFVGSAISNRSLAFFNLGMITGVLAIFSGLTISPADISQFWLFLYWISPYHYLIEGTITTQFYGMEQTIEVAVDGETELMTVEEFVNFYFGGEFLYAHRWWCVGALLASWVVMLLLRVLALRIRFQKSISKD